MTAPRPLGLAMIAATLMLAACATTDPAPIPTETEPPPVYCPNPHGGSCLGELEPGDYTTSAFDPALSYSVSNAGWVNDEDLPGNILFHREADPQTGALGGSYVGVYRDVRAAAQNCEEDAEPGTGHTPAELAGWLASLPGVVDAAPVPVTVGGLDGVYVDLALDPAWTGTCPWSGGLPVTALVIGSGVSQLHHVLLGGMSIRLYLLALDEGNIAIEVTSIDAHIAPDDYRAAVQPLIDSFEFAS